MTKIFDGGRFDHPDAAADYAAENGWTLECTEPLEYGVVATFSRPIKQIHKTRHVSRFGQPFTLVMIESVARDVAVYETRGHVSGEDAAAFGTKWTERDALLEGFTIPTGRHYRR